MTRGTTPTLSFDLPFNTSIIDEAYVTFVQQNNIVIDKSLNDCIAEDHTIKVILTQEETLKFRPGFEIEIQIRARVGSYAIASNIMTTNINRIIKNGVI